MTAPSGSTPLVEVKTISKTFTRKSSAAGGSTTLKALDNVSFHVKRGEIFVDIETRFVSKDLVEVLQAIIIIFVASLQKFSRK